MGAADPDHGDALAANIFDWMFNIARPDRVWVTDVKTAWNTAGWIFASPALELCSRRVFGPGPRTYDDTDLTLPGESCVQGKSPAPGLINHSVHGAPVCEPAKPLADETGTSIASMIRKGDRLVAAMPAFIISTPVDELSALQPTRSKTGTEQAIREYMHGFNIHRGPTSTIGHPRPLAYQLRLTPAAIAE